MYDNEFFVVDVAACKSAGEIINNLSLALETLNYSGKKIVLKLSDNYLNQSQMLSIQSLITSWGSTLDTIETTNEQTREVAQNMNIFTQKPIEKRFDEEYEQTQTKPQNTDEIALKDVNGLHFEADLDAIKERQDKIDISSDMRMEGINPNEDFDKIDEKIASKYPTNEILLEAKEEIKQQPDEAQVEASEDTEEDGLKNSIGVYKKAYDENDINNDWEQVDFYESATDEPVVFDSKETTYINQTLRSGQILESEGNVVIIGDCHPGSEIRAKGDITVWGVLSGIAHAGYKGNNNARVRALKLNAVQLRIGNCYSRRPDTTNIPYIIRTSIFTPEEARIVDGEIMLFKINQN